LKKILSKNILSEILNIVKNIIIIDAENKILEKKLSVPDITNSYIKIVNIAQKNAVLPPRDKNKNKNKNKNNHLIFVL
tara:strand:- start:74 stop:307 length:234 start_codon:yes stop_codon:yes gene_type:complete